MVAINQVWVNKWIIKIDKRIFKQVLSGFYYHTNGPCNFPDMYEMCSFHDSFLSMITPKNFVFWTSFTSSPSILIAKLGMGLFLPENIMKWVFFIFKESLLTRSHLAISFKSSFIILSIHLGSLPLRNKLVSSANNMGNAELQLDGKSFTYTGNNKGPKIDPCGTPHFHSGTVCP